MYTFAFSEKVTRVSKKVTKSYDGLTKSYDGLTKWWNFNFFFFLFMLKSLFQDGRKLSQLYASFLIPVPPFPITNGYIRRHLEDIFMYPTGLLCGGLEGLSLA